MNRPLCIYHGGCFDGFTAAWLFSKVFFDADFHGARYGEDPPDAVGRDVWMVDFSYPRETMEAIRRAAASLRVFDHHKTAQAALDGFECDVLVFDMERCGSRILHEWLEDEWVGGELPPNVYWLVAHIEDRDLWRKQLPDGDFVSAWVAAQPMTFAAWDALAENGLQQAIDSGRHVQAYIDQYGRKARAQMRVERVGGIDVPTINLPYMNCSEHVGTLADEMSLSLFAVGYFRRDDGRWQFSLRSRNDYDVSQIALQYGGGGHKNAAGFDVATLDEVFGQQA